MLSPGHVTFKAKSPPLPLSLLDSHQVLSVAGPDAEAFLQAQLMNDLRPLAPGQWQWNGWLSAKGRLVALMALLRTAPDRFLMVLPDFPAAGMRERLQRYVFRSKLVLAESEWRCAAQFEDVEAFPGEEDRAHGSDAEGWRLDMAGAAGRRVLWLLPPRRAADARASASDQERWLELDLAHGLPRLPAEGIEAWTPQMLSLERLRAFSLKKGCYPGQEIVARTHFLGKAKRGLLRLAGEGLAAGDALRDASGRELGQLACSDARGRQALAVAALDAAVGDLNVNGRRVDVLPLKPGLARPL
jgi:folate-binding protein YgfZ